MSSPWSLDGARVRDARWRERSGHQKLDGQSAAWDRAHLIAELDACHEREQHAAALAATVERVTRHLTSVLGGRRFSKAVYALLDSWHFELRMALATYRKHERKDGGSGG